MNASGFKHGIAGALAMLAMLACQPAIAADLASVQVIEGFRELGGYIASPFLLGGAWIAVKITHSSASSHTFSRASRVSTRPTSSRRA